MEMLMGLVYVFLQNHIPTDHHLQLFPDYIIRAQLSFVREIIVSMCSVYLLLIPLSLTRVVHCEPSHIYMYNNTSSHAYAHNYTYTFTHTHTHKQILTLLHKSIQTLYNLFKQCLFILININNEKHSLGFLYKEPIFVEQIRNY